MQYIHVHFSSIRLQWSFSRTPTWATKINFLRKGLVGWLMCRPCWNCSNSRYRSLWKKMPLFFKEKIFVWMGFAIFWDYSPTVQIAIFDIERSFECIWIHLNQPGLSMPTEFHPSVQGHRVATIPLSTPGAVGNNPTCQVSQLCDVARIVEILNL